MNLYICIHGILGGTRGKNGKGETISPSVLYEHLYEQIIEPNEHYFGKTNDRNMNREKSWTAISLRWCGL